jgi:hypothetical protein
MGSPIKRSLKAKDYEVCSDCGLRKYDDSGCICQGDPKKAAKLRKTKESLRERLRDYR